MTIISDGWKFILSPLILGIVLILIRNKITIGVGVLLVILACFCAYFFRHRDRIPPEDPDAIVAPGDGKVLEVRDIDGEGYGEGKVFRIFLSIFDGHVQYYPVNGELISVTYNPGKFYDARNPKAAFENENNAVVVREKRGEVMIRQIAGMIARRVICWDKPGAAARIGKKFGLIRFGSQVDLYLPKEVDITVNEGDRVVAGETIVGKWLKKR